MASQVRPTKQNMNLEKRITSQDANRRFTHALKMADQYGSVIITKFGKPAYVLASYESYLNERNEKTMMKNELMNNAENGGVWVLAKYLLTDSLNLSEADKVKTLVPTKIIITEAGGVDLIEVRDGIPELKCYSNEQVEMRDAGEMVGIIIDGSPYNRIEFEKGGEKAKETYLNIFLGVSGLGEDELKKYSTPEFKYTLPKVGIVPKTAAYLLEA